MSGNALADALPAELRLSAADVADLTDPFDVRALRQDLKVLLAIVQRCADLGKRPVYVEHQKLREGIGQEWVYPRVIVPPEIARWAE
jgi:hypothetical protein